MKKLASIAIIISSIFTTNIYAGECHITTTFPSGAPNQNIRLVASVGTWGGMTSPVYTDNNGKATITWSSDTTLSEIFVDGKNRHTRCRDGEYLHFTVD